MAKAAKGQGPKVSIVSIDTLTLDPANARKHSPRNMDAIKASLQRFGPQWPLAVVTRDNVVRAGNGRIAAARELGWKEVPVVYSELEGVDAAAFAIADNRTAELAEWDDDVLAATLQSLAEEDAGILDSIGYDQKELDKLLGAGVSTGAGMTLGDVEHRVIVKVAGESEQAALIERLEAEGYECQPLMS